MNREYPQAPLVGVGAVIIQDGKVVLVKRGHPPLAGAWSIPGGVLEVGETLHEAAVREAKEETGLTVEAGELLGVFDRVLRDEQGQVKYHYVLIDFLCRRLGGDLKAAGDAAGACWYSWEQVQELRLAQDTAGVVALGFQKAVESGPNAGKSRK